MSRIAGDRAGNGAGDAAAFAAAQVAAVRDDPAGRLALARTMYEEPAGARAPRPRRGSVDIFLAMRRVLPDAYPAGGALEDYVPLEHRLGRILDFAVIQPRIRRDAPGLSDLVVEGVPAYASGRPRIGGSGNRLGCPSSRERSRR